MSFRVLAYVMTMAGCVLGLRFIFWGTSLLQQWGIEVADGPLLIGRRLGAVYLGLALMFFLGRNAPPSELRSAVCAGMAAIAALLAGLGLFELHAGRMSAGVVIPAVVEGALAAGFAWAWYVGK